MKHHCPKGHNHSGQISQTFVRLETLASSSHLGGMADSQARKVCVGDDTERLLQVARQPGYAAIFESLTTWTKGFASG